VKAEKDTLVHVEHQCIIKMFGAFQDVECIYLVMEYVSGGEFFTHLKERKRWVMPLRFSSDSSNVLCCMVFHSYTTQRQSAMIPRRLPEDAAKFYAAQVLLAFEYLHSQNIIYRDLKVLHASLTCCWSLSKAHAVKLQLLTNHIFTAQPENLLLTAEGDLKVTDFGFAKFVGPTKRTYTLCGTPDYLAPEIILNKVHATCIHLSNSSVFALHVLHALLLQLSSRAHSIVMPTAASTCVAQGHGKAVDWWAFGVFIYEMIAGYPPFYEEDTAQTYQRILRGRFTFPSDFPVTVRDLVRKLLQVRRVRFRC